MAENNEHSEQIIGLTDLMVETLQATIDADRSTAEEYYRILEENSFVQGEDGTTSELQMVNVRIQNSNGQTQIISVPKLILMPIPMLHISEASFEIGGNMCLNTTEETVSEANKTVQASKLTRTDIKSVARARTISRPSNLRVQLANTSAKTTENAESTSNLKISVKMTQSDMPSGLVNLLQVITNNIQVKNE